MSTAHREKEPEAGAEIEVAKTERNEAEDAHKTTIQRAKAATDREHRMSLRTGIRTYPKAIGWSCLISMCIAMEAFDLCLLNTFCMYHFYQGRRERLLTCPRWLASIPREVRREAVGWHLSDTCSMAGRAFEWKTSG